MFLGSFLRSLNITSPTEGSGLHRTTSRLAPARKLKVVTTHIAQFLSAAGKTRQGVMPGWLAWRNETGGCQKEIHSTIETICAWNLVTGGGYGSAAGYTGLDTVVTQWLQLFQVSRALLRRWRQCRIRGKKDKIPGMRNPRARQAPESVSPTESKMHSIEDTGSNRTNSFGASTGSGSFYCDFTSDTTVTGSKCNSGGDQRDPWHQDLMGFRDRRTCWQAR